jgi:hypothetical protein
LPRNATFAGFVERHSRSADEKRCADSRLQRAHGLTPNSAALLLIQKECSSGQVGTDHDHLLNAAVNECRDLCHSAGPGYERLLFA